MSIAPGSALRRGSKRTQEVEITQTSIESKRRSSRTETTVAIATTTTTPTTMTPTRISKQDAALAMTTTPKAKEPKRAKSSDTSSQDQVMFDPFCAPRPNRFRCRFRSTCDSCFHSSTHCLHVREARLRLLVVGHNPSTDVWKHGYSYGNGTNMMWKLLTGTLGAAEYAFQGVLPKGYDVMSQNTLPSDHGVGIAAIALIPGNDANKISKSELRSWIPHFYGRLLSHVHRVQQHEKDKSTQYQGPSIIAFEGKRHFYLLYPDNRSPTPIDFGPLPETVELPPGWPYPAMKPSQIWILPSSSGRAALNHAQRTAPYAALAKALK